MGEVVQLKAEQARELVSLLAEAPLANAAMLELLGSEGAHEGAEFVGYREGGVWRGAMCFLGEIMLYAPEPEAALALAEHARHRQPLLPRFVGPYEAASHFVEHFSTLPNGLLFDRRQWFYRLDQPPELPEEAWGTLRPARLRESWKVASLASAMSAEEIQMDPLREFPFGYLSLVRRRIEKGRYFVYEEEGDIKFQLHLSALNEAGGLISGVYTPPAYRRLGYARAGLASFCRQMLGQMPALGLFVNESNQGALGLYESLGFRPVELYRAVFMAETP